MYLKYFGLREAPFNLTPDPRFFFDSALHREAWASLFYGIKEKKGFVVVTGEVGTGKTTLIRKLLRNLEATHRSVFIFNTLLSFDELLEAILRDLDIESTASGRVAMVQQLNEFLLDQVKQGHTVSVLIDEAQNLSQEALEAVRLLSNMETDREKLLQIILVGQTELDAKLDSRSLRQLKQRISLWCRLDCLSQTDTEAYIRHRLKIAGYEGPDLFTEASIPYIWERTSGIPRLINAVCDNALLTAFATSQKIVSLDIVEEVVRDLRIKPETQRIESMAPDRKDLVYPARRNVGSMAELRDEKIAAKSRRMDDQERPRSARNTPSIAAAEFVPNLPKRELDRDETAARELREFKRQQMRTVASVAELKEKKTTEKGHVVEIGENVWGSAPIPDAFAAPSRNFDDRRDDTTISPAFFDKMVACLTEAMGPMARLVIRGQVAALGESVERFPIMRLPELIQDIKSEILSEPLRTAFEVQIRAEIAQYTKPAGLRYSAR